MAIGSDALNMLVEHVHDDIVQVLFEDSPVNSPVFAMADQKKMDDGMGTGYKIRLETAPSAAVGYDADIVDEINEDGGSGSRPGWHSCTAQSVTVDAPFYFTRDELLAVEGNSAEAFDIMRRSVDSAIIGIRNRLCIQVNEKGWGTIGQISAISSSTVTLPSYLVNRLNVGDRLVASVSEDTDVLLGTPAGDTLTVTAIDEDTGVVTLDDNPETVWANSSSLWVFHAATRLATDPAATASNKKSIVGLPAWVDTAAIFGLTRSGNPDLCGQTVSGSSLSTMDALLKAAERQFSRGRSATHAVVSARSFRLLQQDTNAVKTVTVQLGKYSIGFPKIDLMTAAGPVEVVADPFMPAGTGYLGPFGVKKYAPFFAYSTKGGLVSIDDIDDNKIVRTNVSGQRAFKGTVYFRGQFIVPAPGMYCKLTSMATS